jgi:hypothetical protein
MNAENFLTTCIIIDFEIKGTKEPISYVPFRLDFRLTCNSEIFHIQVTLLNSQNMVIVESSRHWATATHQYLATDCAVSSSSVATQRSVCILMGHEPFYVRLPAGHDFMSRLAG